MGESTKGQVMKFRSKPVEIEAFQLTREYVNECAKNMVSPNYMMIASSRFGAAPDEFQCFSKQGWVKANINDWIISEPDGSGRYPCAPDVFTNKYEPLE